MLKCFLNDQPVDTPLEMRSLTLRKSRNLRYWGFLFRKLGFMDGRSASVFRQPDAIRVLESALDRDGVQAETRFKMESGGTVVYDGFIDYATYELTSDGVSAGLKDDKAVGDFSSQATGLFSLEPADRVGLHPRKLGGLPGLLTDPAGRTVQRSSPAPVAVTHSVPLSLRNQKDETIAGVLAPVVNPLASDPCYRNTSARDQLVSLSGLVVVTAECSGSGINIALKASSLQSPGEGIDVGLWTINATARLITAAVSGQVLVRAGDALKLDWTGSGAVNSWKFSYSGDTRITVSDETTFPASVGYGLTVLSAMQQLTSRTTDGRLTFVSDYLTTGEGFGLLLASGAGIRGIFKSLTVSLDGLFQAVNVRGNMALWAEGRTIRLEPKSKRPRSLSRIDVLISRTERVATDYIYNSIQAGYKTWRSDSAMLSVDEPNGKRVYSTGVTTIRNSLDLVSDFITASGLIETQRRKQFDTKTASENKADALDESLFLIQCVPDPVGWRAETTEAADFVTGVYEPATVYNLRLSPGRMLDAWADWLAPSLPLTTESVEGSNTMVASVNSVVVDEALPLPGVVRSRVPRLVEIVTPMYMFQYANLGELVTYRYNNKTYEGELLDAVWQQDQQVSQATLTLLER